MVYHQSRLDATFGALADPTRREILSRLTLGEQGIARVFEYKLLSQQPGASPFWQMLQHVVNHASYHRGQLTTLLRQLGAQPILTDLMHFYRERQVAVVT